MKKKIKCTLAIALTILMTFGIGIPAFAAPAPAPAQGETTGDRALTFAILLIPYIGPFVALFMANHGGRPLPAFIVTLLVPILGALLYLFGII